MITPDKVLSETQLKKLLNRLKSEKEKSLLVAKKYPQKNNPAEFRNIVDYYLFSLIANTGLRVSEALNLKLKDLGGDFIKIRKEISKNKKSGTVYFGRNTRRLIDEYLVVRLRLNCSEYLFCSKSSRSGRLSRSYIHMRFKYWMMLSGLPEWFSVHSLRHSYATLCLDKGLGLTFVRDQLRHSSIGITSRYLHLTKESRDKVKDIF